jgi:hypothetical protein
MVSVATMPSCHDVREAPCACVCACDLIHPRTSSLWHVHMVRPALYLAGCSSLLGYTGVIDHDPGYVSPKKVACSDVAAKLSRLYRRERQFSFLPPLGVADLGDDTQGFVLMKSTDDWHVALAASNTLSHRPTRRLCQEPIQRSCYTPLPSPGRRGGAARASERARLVWRRSPTSFFGSMHYGWTERQRARCPGVAWPACIAQPRTAPPLPFAPPARPAPLPSPARRGGLLPARRSVPALAPLTDLLLRIYGWTERQHAAQQPSPSPKVGMLCEAPVV